MGAVWMLGRTQLRRRWGQLAALALVTGLGAGFAITAGVAASRASTAWDRMRSATLSPDALFSVPSDADPAKLDQLRALPMVSAVGAFTYTPVAPAPLKPGQDAGAFASLDGSFGVDVYRSMILSGRAANPERDDEVTINEKLAAQGIHVGQRVQLQGGFWPDVHDVGSATVVGVHRGEFDLGINSANAVVILGHRFVEAHRDQIEVGPQPGVGVRLRRGAAARASFGRAVREIYGSDAYVAPGDNSSDPVRQAINVQRVAWTLLAAASGLAVLVAAGQAVSRVVSARFAGARTLVALGMQRRQIAAAGGLVALAVASGAAIVAVAVGVLASPLVPTGLAQRADPDRGIRVEGLVLVVGAGVVILGLVGAGALAAWRAARTEEARERPALGALRRAPLPVTLGSQWALASGPRAAGLSARSALVAVAVALAGVIAVMTFAGSGTRLFGEPRLHGWSFDGGFVAEEDAPTFRGRLPALAADGDVRDLAWGSIADIVVEGEPIEAYALEQGKGALVHPTLLSGRAPAGPNEIVLARGTLDHLGKQVGGSVAVAAPGGEHRLAIVGSAVYPEMGNNGDLSHMASLTAAGLANVSSQPVSSIALVRVREGARAKTVLERNTVEGVERIEPFEPAKVRNLHAAGAAPWLLAGFLAILGLAAVGHALITSVRARRTDIAVLRVLGTGRRQVGWSVAAQATTTAVVGAVIGVPLGIAVGRLMWSLVADGLGVVDDPAVGVLAVVLVLAVTAVAANLLAAGPAAVAARVRPATALRTE